MSLLNSADDSEDEDSFLQSKRGEKRKFQEEEPSQSSQTSTNKGSESER
jgi:hypothetical protein